MREKEAISYYVVRYYKPVVDRRKRKDEMEIMAYLTEFISENATISTEKLEKQVQRSHQKLKAIHELLTSRKVLVRGNLTFKSRE